MNLNMMNSLKKLNSLLFVLISTLLSSPSYASAQFSLDDPTVAAKVNDWTLPKVSLDIYFEYVSATKPELTEALLLSNIIENSLISEFAINKYGEKSFSNGTKVGFKKEIAVQDQLIGIMKFKFNDKISEEIQSSANGNLQIYITKPLNITKNELQQRLALKNKLEYKLTPDQIVSAQSTILLSYKFPDVGEQQVTLWDVYKTTNIQEKLALHQADTQKLKELVQRLISNRYVLYWMGTHSGLSEIEINTLRKLVSDNRTARDYYLYSGFKTEIHHQNERLKDLAKNVTLKEIKPYYERNKEEFRSTIKVKARHITLDSQSLADKVYTELNGGLDFSAAIKKYSIANDKNDPVPGSLGWIMRKDKNRDWLRTLPFTKQTGEFSPPYMSPKKGYPQRIWEIVIVDDRVEGYYEYDSETVRYQASKYIAKMKVDAQVTNIQKELKAKADIKINAIYASQFAESDVPDDLDLFHREHNHDHTKK